MLKLGISRWINFHHIVYQHVLDFNWEKLHINVIFTSFHLESFKFRLEK